PSGDTSEFAQDVTATVGAAVVRSAVALVSQGAGRDPSSNSLALGALDGDATFSELATDVIRWRRQRLGVAISYFQCRRVIPLRRDSLSSALCLGRFTPWTRFNYVLLSSEGVCVFHRLSRVWIRG